MKHPFLLASIIIAISAIFASFNCASFTVHAESTNSTGQVSISGLVNQPLNFTLAALEAMPQTTISASLYCVDSPTDAVEQGAWQGVKLWTLINETGPKPEATKIAFHASDGYSTDLTIDLAKSDNIILAYAINDAPLSEVLRLVVPGHWGYKWISQVTSIELVNYNFKGTWENQGYSDDASIGQPIQPGLTPYPYPIVQATPSASPSPSPKQSPTTSPAIPPTANSTSQSKSLAQPRGNAILQDSGQIEILAIVLIAIVTIALIISRKKNGRNRNDDSQALSTQS
jgi:DMSO/TMAO reductase YedYZ molybdopterin-dependent catalytic subunit